MKYTSMEISRTTDQYISQHSKPFPQRAFCETERQTAGTESKKKKQGFNPAGTESKKKKGRKKYRNIENEATEV